MFTSNTETNLRLLGDTMDYLGHKINHNPMFDCWTVNYCVAGPEHPKEFHDAIEDMEKAGEAKCGCHITEQKAMGWFNLLCYTQRQKIKIKFFGGSVHDKYLTPEQVLAIYKKHHGYINC